MFEKAMVDKFVEQLRQCFADDLNEYDSTIKCIEKIVDEYGTNEYNFNYSAEMFVELYWRKINKIMPYILDDLISQIKEINCNEKTARKAFVAYYFLSLIYKKNKNIDGLKMLLEDTYFLELQSFPLTYEVRARCLKREGYHKKALISDLQAIQILKSLNIINPAVHVSYASTVAMICESGNIETLVNNEIDDALSYIEEAINFNPSYPKYYFIKGKLTFYKNKNNPDFFTFKQSCIKAKEYIQEAFNLRNNLTRHYANDGDIYYNFIELIDTSLSERDKENKISESFKKISNTEMCKKKNEILNSNRAQECRPLSPTLKTGQKYIFISYCTHDYKSVYCDLVELYANKIPFCYDEALIHGENWDDQVKEKINNDDCVGILFYLSSNTVLSESIEKEIEMINQRFNSLDEFKEHCFWVNLEIGKTPFTLLLKAIQQNSTDTLLAKHVSPTRLTTYLNTFKNEAVFTEKDSVPDSNNHIEELIHSIEDKFPTLFENKDTK